MSIMQLRVEFSHRVVCAPPWKTLAVQFITYQTRKSVQSNGATSYIDELKAPTGTLHYDAIFDRAKDSVGKAWSSIEKAVYGDDANAISFFGDWNLDTGRNNKNELVFWA